MAMEFISKIHLIHDYLTNHILYRLFHCAPNVPHYAKNKAVGVMKPGHCFTIEPMISEGVWGDQTWPDNWTSVTQVNKFHSYHHFIFFHYSLLPHTT